LKKYLIIMSFIFLPLFSYGAVKHTKVPKPTVSGLTRQLAAANDTISELQAIKVSLTARVTTQENEIKKLKQSKDQVMNIVYIGGGAAVLLAVFLILIKSMKSGGETKKVKKNGKPDRESHFADIEYNVLDDWHNIWYHPEKINKELYDDLKNHYAELYTKIEKWKLSIGQRGVFTGHLISLLSTKFPDIEGTDSIYMLAFEDMEPFIEDNEIAVGTNVCARAKRDASIDAKTMKEYYKEVLNLFETEFREVKSLTNEVALLKDEIDVDIRKIKHFRNLPGDCKFIKV
jgi:hypothetical protein